MIKFAMTHFNKVCCGLFFRGLYKLKINYVHFSEICLVCYKNLHLE